LEYTEFSGRPRQWALKPVPFGKINLIVGRNASGKTRLINVIGGLASLLSGTRRNLFHSAYYKAIFAAGNLEAVYTVAIENGLVQAETFNYDREVVLDRQSNGRGTIKAVQIQAQKLQFEAPPAQLAAVLRRDAVQHPFLQLLYDWGTSVKHYRFGTDMGAHVVSIEMPGKQPPDAEKPAPEQPLDPNNVHAIFKRGVSRFGDDFKRRILKTLRELDYSVHDVGFEHLARSEFQGTAIPPTVLYARERGLTCNTRQLEMSAGMFRALNLAVQINYWALTGAKICMLVDDVGEGLDFDRATRLIRHLVKQCQENDFQLIMTTNDRFVMNDVPLQYWAVLDRKGHTVRVINKNNSPELFDRFERVGLNNFDFFAKKFYLTPKTQRTS
jgi:energy-coupling factor transporter ATP-binding protein EcfA2